MTGKLDDIKREIDRLGSDDRVLLLDWLLENDLSERPRDLAPEWLDEAERRRAEVASGKVTAVPGEDVFRRLEEKHGLKL